MAGHVVDEFIEALGRLEGAREVEPMAALYAEGAEVGNVVAPEKYQGAEGAREFWAKYRDTFGEVRSTFRNRVVGGSSAALEWTTEGTTAGGAPVRYEGVSVLEFEGERLTRFRAYFDPQALGEQVAEGAGRKA